MTSRSEDAIDQRSKLARPRMVIRWLTAPVRLAWRWFAHQPRALQIGLVLVVLAALATGGYFGWSFVKKRSATEKIGAAWKNHAYAVGKADVDEIRAALHRVLEIDPDNPTAKQHLAMLDSGEADPDQWEMAVVLLHNHIRHDRLVEAAREGEKVLIKNPKYWQARCAVAHHALQVKNDRKLAEQHLAQLADPEDPAAGVNAGGLLYALRLSDLIGRDATALRRLIVRRLLPFLRGKTAEDAPVSAKMQLLECYLEPFTDRSLLVELADYIGVADRLADRAVSEAVAAGDVEILVRLGKFGPRSRAALAAIRANDPTRLPDDKYAPLVKAVDERTRRAWQAVRDKDPGRVEAYLGLANCALLGKDPNAAIQQVQDGIKACGDRVEFLELQMWLVATYRPETELLQVAEKLRQAAVAAKNDPTKWCLVAMVWRQLRHNDRFLIAVDEALAIQRDHPLACRLKASILVESGTTRDLMEAGELVGRLGELTRRVDPEIAHLNARIMVGRGLWPLVEEEFDKVLETQARIKPKTSVPAIGFLTGVLSAPPTIERAEWVAERAGRVMAADEHSAGARLIRFKALYRLADLSVTMDPRGGPPIWSTARVAVALRAFEDLGLDERTRPDVVAQVAALQLKGERNAVVALRTANGLLAAEGSLNSFEMEVLGSVLAANGKGADAVRILERAEKVAEKMRGSNVGLRVALAVAYHANNQPGDGKAALQSAESLPNRSAREHAELVAAKQQFRE